MHTSSTFDGGAASFAFDDARGLLTPAKMLELPRTGPGIPNPSGDLVLVSAAQWAFSTRRWTRTLHVVAVDAPGVVAEHALDAPAETFWLDARTLALVAPDAENADVQALYALPVHLDTASGGAPRIVIGETSRIGVLPTGAAQDFVYSASARKLVISADVYADYDLRAVLAHNQALAERGTSARVYDGTFVRHWDTWAGPTRSALFAVSLTPTESTSESGASTWVLGDEYVCPMRGTGHASPVAPFGGTDDFAVSETHLLYASRDPALAPAFHTRRNIYIAPLDASEPPRALTSGTQGETHCPVFSNDGKRAAWLEMAEDGNDADKLRIVIYDLEKDVRFFVVPGWDRSPDSLVFSHDDSRLYVTAHEHGRAKAFVLAAPKTPAAGAMDTGTGTGDAEPRALTSEGTAHTLCPLPDGRLVFSKSTMAHPSEVYFLGSSHDAPERRLTRIADAGLKDFVLEPPREVWFAGAEGRQVHGWVLLPPGFERGAVARYPALLLIHGGPQAAWNDQWSTRFNPQVWAAQGYVVFVPNFTGSTGFGQAFVDAVARDWGGAPFEDMRKGWAHVLAAFPEIDRERAGAVGGSWGGYAVNFIQGHPEFGFGFKGLVCHDGEFDSTYSGYSCDEQFIFSHEWGGRPWDAAVKARTDRMSPHHFVHKWSIPQLLLHGSNDFRVSETQAIAAFHALQQRGVPSRLVVFPDENHFVSRPGNSLEWHLELFRFLDEHVKVTRA